MEFGKRLTFGHMQFAQTEKVAKYNQHLLRIKRLNCHVYGKRY